MQSLYPDFNSIREPGAGVWISQVEAENVGFG